VGLPVNPRPDAPQELRRAADGAGKVSLATEVTRLVTPSSTETRPHAARQRPWRTPSPPVLHLHPTRYCYTGDASPSAPGGITVIYRDLIADEQRTRQVIADAATALSHGRNLPHPH
jgi:hypothetical protein